MKLTDKDLMNDWLSSEKDLVKTYATMLCEASNDKIRSAMKNCMEAASDSQFNVYCKMSSRGMYATEIAEKQKIDQTKQQFGEIKQQIDDCGCASTSCKGKNCGC